MYTYIHIYIYIYLYIFIYIYIYIYIFMCILMYYAGVSCWVIIQSIICDKLEKQITIHMLHQ